MNVEKLNRGRPSVLALAAMLLCACSQTSPPPASAPSSASSPNAPAEQGAPANQDPAPPAAAQQKDMSVADLLSSSKTDSANASTGAPAQRGTAPADASSEAPVDAANVGEVSGDDAAFARVVSVQPIPGPRQICTDQTIVERRPSADRHHVAGTVIGALVGGAVGSRFGRGSGRTVATVGGAVAGGAIGRDVQRNNDNRDTVTRVVTHCRPAHREEAGVTLYDVIYAYQGQNFHIRLDHEPGDRLALPVRGVE